ERAERMQGGESTSREWCRRLAQPDLRSIRREDPDALARSKAALAKNGDPSREQVGRARVAEIASILTEGDTVRKSSQCGKNQVGVGGGFVKARNRARIVRGRAFGSKCRRHRPLPRGWLESCDSLRATLRACNVPRRTLPSR